MGRDGLWRMVFKGKGGLQLQPFEIGTYEQTLYIATVLKLRNAPRPVKGTNCF